MNDIKKEFDLFEEFLSNKKEVNTLTIDGLEQALEQNERDLEKALISGSLELVSNLSVQRAILKDCMIEALTANLNQLKRAA